MSIPYFLMIWSPNQDAHDDVLTRIDDRMKDPTQPVLLGCANSTYVNKVPADIHRYVLSAELSRISSLVSGGLPEELDPLVMRDSRGSTESVDGGKTALLLFSDSSNAAKWIADAELAKNGDFQYIGCSLVKGH